MAPTRYAQDQQEAAKIPRKRVNRTRTAVPMWTNRSLPRGREIRRCERKARGKEQDATRGWVELDAMWGGFLALLLVLFCFFGNFIMLYADGDASIRKFSL